MFFVRFFILPAIIMFEQRKKYGKNAYGPSAPLKQVKTIAIVMNRKKTLNRWRRVGGSVAGRLESNSEG